MTATTKDPSGRQDPKALVDEPRLVTEDSTIEAEEETTVENILRIRKADIF